MELIEQLRLELGDYTIERELAGGGMARVFVAFEPGLARRVVIKLVAPELAAGVSVERFRREILLSARLQHPHIVPVLTAGEIDGVPYFTMPFVEGETLAHRIARHGALPLGDCLRLMSEMASALAYAHESGVIHRDIKPANVLLSGGIAMVSDFGVAKALRVAADRVSTGATSVVGLTFGTPAYMAPEQATADPELDHRADVYSFGAVAYEMLTGRAVFEGTSAQKLVAAHLVEIPKPVRGLRADVPPAIDALVARCLAKNPADRPTSAELVRQIASLAWSGAHPVPLVRRVFATKRRVAMVAGLLLIGSGVAGAALVPAELRATLRTLWQRQPRVLDPRVIVVAPLANRTGDTSLAMLGDLAAEFIAQRLSQVDEVSVVDPTSALIASKVVARTPRLFRDADEAIAIAEETGAGTLLAGAYYKEGDSLRFLLRLVDVAARSVRETTEPVAGFRGRPTEVLPLLSLRAAATLATTIDTNAKWFDRPSSLEAYRLMMAGFDRYNQYDTATAFAMFERAAALDTGFISPLMFHFTTLIDYAQIARARHVYERIAERLDRFPPAQRRFAMGYEPLLRGDYVSAARLFAQAASQSGNGEIGHLAAAGFAVYGNAPRLALASLARVDHSRGVSLGTPLYWKIRGAALWQLGEHADALANARQAASRYPDHPKVRYLEIRALAGLGWVEELEARLERSVPSAPSGYTPETWSGYSRLHAARILRGSANTAASDRILAALVARVAILADSSASALLLRAYTSYEAGRLDECRAIVARGSIVAPTHVDFQGLSALLAEHAGRPDESGRIARQLQARPDSTELLGRHYRWLARLSALRGDTLAAVQFLRTASERGEKIAAEMPDDGHWENFDARLDLEFRDLRKAPAFLSVVAPRS